MSSPTKLIRLGAALAALAVGLLFAAPASASDTFGLNNDSKVATLSGYSLWGKGNTMAQECRTGPFPGPTETPFTFNPGDHGSITLTRDPFSSCLPGINPLVDQQLTSPNLTYGVWTWIPDDPFVGYASLTCDISLQNGSQPVESSVDGLTCTISDGSSQPAGSFNSSAAPVRGGDAVVYVQHFPGTKAGAAPAKKSSGRYEVVLSDLKGHGRTETTIVSGHSRTVRIPISKALRKKVGKKGHVQVKATLKRIDGKPGSGDHAILKVMKDQPTLPF